MLNKLRPYIWIICLPALLILSACGTNTPEPTPVPSATAAPGPSATFTATVTASATATSTDTPTPTITFTPTSTFTPTLTATLDWQALMKTQVLVYLVNVIDVDTCHYETLPVPVPSRPKTGDMLTDVEWALRSLFVTKAQRIGYLTNPLAASQLGFERITLEGNLMNIYIEGSVVQTDSVCNDSQARDQVFSTIRRYVEDPNIQVVVWVGPYLLDDLLWRK